MSDDYDEKYTEPDVRRRIKDELMKSDKGGKAGEWSARKSQLLASEYEKQGGGYRGEKDERQKSLDKWTDEDWQTAGGSADARHGDTTERYLPKAVWDKLSQKERKKAMRTKEEASKKGEQHVDWTPAVQRAMREGRDDKNGPTKQELMEQAKKLEIKGRSTMNKDELAQAVEKAKK
jgi:hypothetical protein